MSKRSRRRARRAAKKARQRIDRNARRARRAALGMRSNMSNADLREQFNRALAGKTSVIDERAARGLMAVTESIWNRDGVSNSERLDAIMRHFKTNSLRTAFDRAMEAAEVESRKRGYTGSFTWDDYETVRLFSVGFFTY